MLDKYKLTLIVEHSDVIEEEQIEEYVSRSCEDIEELDGIRRVFIEEERIEEFDGEQLLETLLSVSKRELIESLDSIQSMDKGDRQN